MNLSSQFPSLLASPPRLAAGYTPKIFLGTALTEESIINPSLFHILSGGSIHASFPYSFDIASLPCAMLLHTTKGSAKLSNKGKVYTLHENSLLLLACTERFRLDIVSEFWDYHVYFIAGGIFELAKPYCRPDSHVLYSLPPHSEPALQLQQLTGIFSDITTTGRIRSHKVLHSIIIDLLLEQQQKKERCQKLPSYLKEIKLLFDEHYNDSYSLDDLEEYFHISKYKLCREFQLHFHTSPIHYLNNRRIQMAKHYLSVSDFKIHEIGSMVGIDNTTHFITLFKRETGITPNLYRHENF